MLIVQSVRICRSLLFSIFIIFCDSKGIEQCFRQTFPYLLWESVFFILPKMLGNNTISNREFVTLIQIGH